MNAFDESRQVEKSGMPLAIPMINRLLKPGWTNLNSGDVYALQSYGDVLGQHRRHGSVVGIEIKSDGHTSLNIFIETESDAGNRPGWIRTSKADFLIYQKLKHGKQFLFSMPRLQWWFERNSHLYDEVDVQADQKNRTRGCCVPMSVLEGVAMCVEDITTPSE